MTGSLLPPFELFVQNAALTRVNDGVDILVLSCRGPDGSRTIEISRDREDTPYDRALGLVGCCVCVDASATAYDAVVAWERFDETVELRLSAEGARTLSWPARVTLRCGAFFDVVVDALRVVVGPPL